MEPIRINLSDYERSGEGANGASYFHKTDPTVMLKLSSSTLPREVFLREYEISCQVYNAGIPTPRPGELVTDGENLGIRFERIQGKKSFSRAIGDDPAHVESYARRFARLCLKLHSTHVDTSIFDDARTRDLEMLKENPYFTAEEKEKVAAFIKSVPDSDIAYHGDLQYSNAIITGDKEYFIDLGDFGHGHPWLDLGMVILCSVYDDEEFIREVFHMDAATAADFWKYFVREYFGENADIEKINSTLRPYAGLKTLIIERNSGIHFPQFHKLLDGIIQG